MVNTKSKAIKKTISAIFSYFRLKDSFEVRIAKKENILQVINNTQAIPVNSSMRVSEL